MSNKRLLSKLILPGLLIAVYLVTLTQTIAEPEEPYSRTLQAVVITHAKEVQMMVLSPSLPQTASSEEPILVIELDRFSRAYRLADFAPGLTVFQARLGDAEVVVFADGATQTARAYRAETQGQPLQFSLQGAEISDASGTIWSMDGLALSGPHTGAQLVTVSAFFTDWATWLAAHPQATLSVP